jgi:NhaA family Na+:H+ antiporter
LWVPALGTHKGRPYNNRLNCQVYCAAPMNEEERMAQAPTVRQSFREPPIDQILRPFQEFFRIEASSGIILLACTAVALIWANSPWGDSYFSLWLTKLSVDIGGLGLSKPLILWINDGLMALFFFLVGLEIKREVLVGELSSPGKASLPIAAAIGGMAVPAAIYTAVNWGGEGADGWGIPMATDIAFALGVLALLGNRVPLSLRIFVTALAIVDDLGAVLVIALFYTSDISWSWLAVGGGFLLLMILVNRLGVRRPLVYGLLGICLWFAFLKSGVHATVAGVLAAMTIPAAARINTRQFVTWGREVLDEIERCCVGDSNQDRRTTASQRSLLQAMETAVNHAEAPLQRLEHSLEYPVAYAIMPLFALANAGVRLGGGSNLFHPVSLGIIAGLVLGKQLGITFFTWLNVRLGLATLPDGVTWAHIYGVGWLTGIGFTMSLFIASLAFGVSPLLSTAKVGILTASVIAGVGGWLILRASSSAR